MEEGIIPCNMDLAMMLWKNNVKRLLKVHDHHRSESFANNSKDTLLRRIRTQGLFFQKSRTSCKNLATREIHAVDSPLRIYAIQALIWRKIYKVQSKHRNKTLCTLEENTEEKLQGCIMTPKGKLRLPSLMFFGHRKIGIAQANKGYHRRSIIILS
ncbi:hypothetical protein FF1_022412 [Malus domestica]